jgi:hypothetical protein
MSGALLLCILTLVICTSHALAFRHQHNQNHRSSLQMHNKPHDNLHTKIRRAVAHVLTLSIPLGIAFGASSPAFADSKGPDFVLGSNVGLALNAYVDNSEALTCTLDDLNFKGDQSSCQQLDQVVRYRAGHLITIKQDWGGSVSTGAAIWSGENIEVWYMENVLGAKEFQGKSVIELGSGVGYSGLVASLLGSSNVVITDGNEDVLKLADENVLNNLQDANKGTGKTVTTARLRWNTEDEASFTKDHWDYILASDVTYLKKNWPDLLHTISALSGPSTRTVLSLEPRNIGEVEGVLQEAAKAGLQWTEEVLPSSEKLKAEGLCGLSCPRVFLLTKASLP